MQWEIGILIAQVVELTDFAKEFLNARFTEFDKDKDGILSPSEQDDMYSTSPSRSACSGHRPPSAS